MATIFEKVAASGERCIILDPREGVLYTFNFGDWRQIRMAAFVSLTNINDNNGAISDETITPNGLGRNQFYFGFKDSGLLVPVSTGSLFAGFVGSDSLTNNISITTSSNVLGGSNMISTLSGSLITSKTTFSNIFRVGTSGTNFANTGYGQFNCVTLNRNASYTGIAQFNSPSVDFTDVSLRNLRALLDSSVTLNANGLCCSGYFSNDLNSAFIYSPFNNNRIRVHALVVEKYA